jgi:hypothetical protein
MILAVGGQGRSFYRTGFPINAHPSSMVDHFIVILVTMTTQEEDERSNGPYRHRHPRDSHVYIHSPHSQNYPVYHYCWNKGKK